MRHFIRTKVLVGSAAIACLSILSGCWHHRRDPAYVEHVDVHVDDHHDHHEDRR